MHSLKKNIGVLLVLATLITLFSQTHSVAETDYNGYWRLIEIKMEESEYSNPAPSDYRVRAIEFTNGDLTNLEPGQMMVVNNVTTEEPSGMSGLYQAYYQWGHPQTLLKAGQKYQFRLFGQQTVNSTTLMLGNSITCSHQLLSPEGVYQPAITEINNASLALMNKEYGESGLKDEHIFEFSPRVPDQKREYGYIFRVTIGSGKAYRRYDYIYDWVGGLYPSAEEIRVFINHNLLIPEVPPMIIESRTLLPLRAILEALGSEVGWDGKTQQITATKGDTVLILHIGSKEASLNGASVLIDAAPLIVSGRTLVPARFLAESFGATVHWDGINRIITITY